MQGSIITQQDVDQAQAAFDKDLDKIRSNELFDRARSEQQEAESQQQKFFQEKLEQINQNHRNLWQRKDQPRLSAMGQRVVEIMVENPGLSYRIWEIAEKLRSELIEACKEVTQVDRFAEIEKQFTEQQKEKEG